MNKHAISLREVYPLIHILLTIFMIVFYLQLPHPAFRDIQKTSEMIEDETLRFFELVVVESSKEPKPEPEPESWEQMVDSYTVDICENYPNVSPQLVQSVIWHESRYQPGVSNGSCVGLMQVSTYWHAGRAEKLGVTDFYDPQGNILVGVDYLSDLISSYGDVYVALMVYNGDANANKYYTEGYISSYARSVVSRQQELEVNSLAAKEG